MLTAFASTRMGRTHIRAREYQFQTHGEIDALQEPGYVSSMRQDFSYSLELDIEFEPDEMIGERAHAIRHGIAKTDGQAKGETTEEEEQKEFHDHCDDPPVEEPQDLQCYSRKSSTSPWKREKVRTCWMG
jgi:hypothetical protein